MKKKLYKTRYGAKFCGVLKGFSEYFNIDVTTPNKSILNIKNFHEKNQKIFGKSRGKLL